MSISPADSAVETPAFTCAVVGEALGLHFVRDGGAVRFNIVRLSSIMIMMIRGSRS